MYILAFETSCDDTSVAIMHDDSCIGLATHTQLAHNDTGGVVPEVAARMHANAIFSCLDDALLMAGISLDMIDSIACTDHPGLLPSLLTGMTVAKTLSLTLKKPLFWIDHVEGHIFANYLERKKDEVQFPNIVLTVSGWHTELYLWKSMYERKCIGQTLDDAAWEAFDKVAKLLWLGFPGGAKIAELAGAYTRKYQWLFPLVMLEKDSLDFSFSWLKTAVKHEIDRRGDLSLEDVKEICYEFEEAVIRVLREKLFRASEVYDVPHLSLAWGVSANTKLRERIAERAREEGKTFLAPVKNLYSQDNAAMIGIRAYYEIIRWTV